MESEKIHDIEHGRNEGIGSIKQLTFPNIFIWGLSGSGKDTLANILVSDFNYFKIRIADTIKRIIMEQENLTFEELEKLKRIKPELRNRHNEIGLYMDAKNGTKHRISQIINRTALDFQNLPEEIKNKKFVICDCRGISEAETFLDANYYGIFLSKKPEEYVNTKHWTEKDMFQNDEIKILLRKYGNKIIPVFNETKIPPSHDVIKDICEKIWKDSKNGRETLTLFPRSDYFVEDMKMFLYDIFTFISHLPNKQ